MGSWLCVLFAKSEIMILEKILMNYGFVRVLSYGHYKKCFDKLDLMGLELSS
jgi:hypothetical protein